MYELDCNVEINIIRYKLRMGASRGEKECNRYEKVKTKRLALYVIAEGVYYFNEYRKP